ncbi:MAG TPA: TetR/AcrR family transcriptional regulator [Candidatus Corynebacterium avicola]|uniref:TetR/AcrR family transcriptional regulator n=1 Tax=Candidatus Corynebacterium avicola TaxID=2838527 RepID=A0A9D1RKR1_9CORY|nr:TetR/AcrR family transcriptional regulator [Candidatus Corynebacterium avicola]
MRADARENREAIVTAACTLFAEHGPEVSLRSVATAADVGIATLYRHFPTRDDLIIGISERIATRALEVIHKYIDSWDGTWETWRGFVHDLAGLRLASIAMQTVAAVELDGPVWQATENFRTRLLDGYRELLPLAVESGFISPALDPWQFHFGVAFASRPLPENVTGFTSRLSPGFPEWYLDTFICGLAESAGKHG